MNCTYCNSEKTSKNGKEPSTGKQRYKCTDCGRQFTPEGEPTSKPKIGMTLEEFKKRYDLEYKVKTALESLDKGMIYEKADVCQLAGVSVSAPGINNIMDKFGEYQGRAGGKVLFSHPSTIKTLIESAKMT